MLLTIPVCVLLVCIAMRMLLRVLSILLCLMLRLAALRLLLLCIFQRFLFLDSTESYYFH